MKRLILTFLLFILPFWLLVNLYFLDKEYFLCPIDYEREIIIRSDDWGKGEFLAKRRNNRLHLGIDLFAPIATPVRAVRSGKVIEAGTVKGLGNYIIILHSDNLTTVYGHLLKIYVSKNQLVRQGQIIGEVGKTGNANHPNIQPHLHFEVRKNGLPQDPLNYLL